VAASAGEDAADGADAGVRRRLTCTGGWKGEISSSSAAIEPTRWDGRWDSVDDKDDARRAMLPLLLLLILLVPPLLPLAPWL
jgi:hypothetical protein